MLTVSSAYSILYVITINYTILYRTVVSIEAIVVDDIIVYNYNASSKQLVLLVKYLDLVKHYIVTKLLDVI